MCCKMEGSDIYQLGHHFCEVVLIIWIAIGLTLVHVIIYVVQPVLALSYHLAIMAYFSR